MKRPQAVVLIQERDAVGTIPSTDELSRVDYCGNMVYDRGERRLLLENGYVTFDAATETPSYHFYLRDHLGNNRVVIARDGTVEQVTHYYPFGGLMRESTNPAVQPYKYGGKEIDRTSGLDAYDFGARTYFADRLQWGQVDPMCEKYYDWSPYNYCANRPANAFDPDGKESMRTNGGEKFKRTGILIMAGGALMVAAGTAYSIVTSGGGTVAGGGQLISAGVTTFKVGFVTYGAGVALDVHESIKKPDSIKPRDVSQKAHTPRNKVLEVRKKQKADICMAKHMELVQNRISNHKIIKGKS